MSNASDYLETQIINTFFRTGTKYVALCTTACTDAALGTEVVGGSFTYTRKVVTLTAPAADGAGNMFCHNDASLDWSNLPACVIVSAAVMDASSGGNMLSFSSLSTSRGIPAGAAVSIPIGELVVQVR